MRPKFHFTPERGWINDPNGLIFIDGKYHLFFQHYPLDTHWGPMHWGHAVSDDLLSFTEKEIALFPDNLGYIFSGSAVLDKENLSGLSDGKHIPLILMYTSHDPETNVEQQSISYSLDYEHFVSFSDNPVIENKMEDPSFKKDFRDPKLFKNKIKGGFTACIAAGDHVEFFHTLNFHDFTKTGEFYPGDFGFSGIVECPDLIHIENECEADVLTMSMILPKEKIGKSINEKGFPFPNVMQYFVGTFDGDTFILTEKMDAPNLLDFGPDSYAVVSFSETEENILLGWGENWHYVDKTPADSYRGKLTLGRKASLLDTEKGKKLKFMPFPEVCETYFLSVNEELEFKWNEAVLHIRLLDDKYLISRSMPNDSVLKEVFQDEKYREFTVDRINDGDTKIKVVSDEGYFELFLDDGFIPFSISLFE